MIIFKRLQKSSRPLYAHVRGLGRCSTCHDVGGFGTPVAGSHRDGAGFFNRAQCAGDTQREDGGDGRRIYAGSSHSELAAILAYLRAVMKP